MPTSNPFSEDPVKAEAWQLGYAAGFQDPDGTDTFRPLSPDLLDIFTLGNNTGRQDRTQPPTANQGAQWASKSQLDSESNEDMVEHLSIEGLAKLSEDFFHAAEFGLIGIVLTVIGVSTDSPMKPLEDDFDELYTGPEVDTNVFYIGVCPRTDHAIPQIGTTPEGYWAGTGHNDFTGALTDTLQHGHSEAMVARCSLTDGTCGTVWVAQQQ